MKLPVVSGSEASKAFRKIGYPSACQPTAPTSVSSLRSPSAQRRLSNRFLWSRLSLGRTFSGSNRAGTKGSGSNYFFWHRGQKCVPRCVTRILRILVPQRGQGSPVFW